MSNNVNGSWITNPKMSNYFHQGIDLFFTQKAFTSELMLLKGVENVHHWEGIFCYNLCISCE